MKIYHFYHFDSDPRFPKFLLYVTWTSEVTFVRRCLRDVTTGLSWFVLVFMDQHCGGTISIWDDSQIRLKLTSDYHYKSNTQCQLTIETNYDEKMMFYFRDLDTENVCSNDWLEIDDGTSRGNPYLAGNHFSCTNAHFCFRQKLVNCLTTTNRILSNQSRKYISTLCYINVLIIVF